MRLSYAIVLVSDMERSVAFYRDVIGLPLRFQSASWSELATEGATLALHAGVPAKSTPAVEAERRHERHGRCRPGLSVPDLVAFHRRMVESGVPCLQEPSETFGARIAQYSDPDGLAISVSEERRGKTARDGRDESLGSAPRS